MKKCKYLFICGAVASGIGKGVINSSIGMLLKECGYNVALMKIDPYLNVDAGTMNPYEHGEVFVTADGGEVDLDLGNYERFIGQDLSFYHSLTTGKLYEKILQNEREGVYLGKTVQIIPHVVNYIKDYIRSNAKTPLQGNEPDIMLVEVGGVVGDIESTHYYEAVRQMINEEGQNQVGLIMLTYILLINGEQKTKPTQNGIKDLRYTGLIADFIVCRGQNELEQPQKQKIALFANTSTQYIFSVPDCEHIYDVPDMLLKQGFIDQILKKLNLPKIREPDIQQYTQFKQIQKQIKLKEPVTIGIFGKYVKNLDAYMSLTKALNEAAHALEINLKLSYIDLTILEEQNDQEYAIKDLQDKLKQFNGILVPGGFGSKCFDLKVSSANYARLNKIPYLGICYGFQAAVVEYARNVMNIKGAVSEENDKQGDHYIVYMPEINPKQFGGNMRLGDHTTIIQDKDSLAFQIYQNDKIVERHRHRYEVNPQKIASLEENGLRFTGRDTKGERMEVNNYFKFQTKKIFELPQNQHPFYVGVQFHPEFTSKNFKPNPLFISFLKAVQLNK